MMPTMIEYMTQVLTIPDTDHPSCESCEHLALVLAASPNMSAKRREEAINSIWECRQAE